MYIEKNNEKITITFDKKEDNCIYKQLSSVDKLDKYILYLLKLDEEINGTDAEYFSNQVVELYEDGIKEKTKNELLQIKEDVLKDIINYSNYLYEAIPLDFKKSFYGPQEGVINIPSDDIVANLKMCADRLEVINRLIISSAE